MQLLKQKYHKVGRSYINSGHLFLTSEGCKSKIKKPADLVSVEDCLSGSWAAILFLSPFMHGSPLGQCGH